MSTPSLAAAPAELGFRQTVWPRMRNFIGGYASGMALVLVGHPFDTVKVRLQTEGAGGRFSGPISCLVQTVKHEGIRGLYKGVTPPLFATGVINSIMFGVQGLVVRQVTGGKRQATIADTAVSAVFSGLFISTLVTPMEGIKSRLQVQYNAAKNGATPTTQYTGPVSCAKGVIEKLGWRNGIYRGWMPVAFCRASNWAYFGSYEYFRQAFAPKNEDGTYGKMSLPSAVLAGGLTGFCYWFACYPMDVIKARIQAQPDTKPPMYRGIGHTAGIIYKNEGLKGFFRGFTPCLIRAFPANAACFVAYEAVMAVLPE